MTGLLTGASPFLLLMHEQWKPVVGWEGLYEVSNLGQVRTLGRKDRNGRTVRQIVRSQVKSNCGYYQITLYHLDRVENVTVHSLVARAFLGERPDGLCVHHFDGGRTTNVLVNLKYVTPSHNIYVSVMPCKESHPHAKLTDAKVEEIRRLYKTMPNKTLAETFGISTAWLWKLVTNQNWKKVRDGQLSNTGRLVA